MLKLSLAAAALLVSSVAVAQTTDLSSFSVQGDFGYARHKAGSDGDHESGSAFAPGIAISYHIDEQWSVRLQYTDAGEFEVLSAELTDYQQNLWIDFDRTLDSKASWLGLTAQYQTLQAPQSWSFGARAGVGFWKQEFTVTDTISAVSNQAGQSLVGQSFSESGSDSGAGLLAGVFAHYHFSEQLALTVDLDLASFSSNAIKDIEMFADLDDTKADYHVSRIAVGVQYRF